LSLRKAILQCNQFSGVLSKKEAGEFSTIQAFGIGRIDAPMLQDSEYP